MATITKILFNGTGTNGFTMVANGGFDSHTIASGYLLSEESNALPGSYTMTFQQGATTNKYSDWGIPSNATIQGIQLMAFGQVFSGVNGSGTDSSQVSISISESFLGDNPIGGSYVNLTSYNLTGDSYIRVNVDSTVDIDFDPEESYGTATLEVNTIELQITYTVFNKGGMFFGI